MTVLVLLAAGGAAWEASAIRTIEDSAPRLVLLRRCVDLSDLLVGASAGSASAAVIDARLAGLDADAVARLQRGGLSVVVVGHAADHDRLARLGVDHRMDPGRIAALPAMLEGVDARPTAEPPRPATAESRGEVVAVWGPAGAPGRTTVAVGLAAELAHRGQGTLLLDADPYGGAVAQHLGILDQVSGLLACARLANAGELDAERLAAAARRVNTNLRVLGGLPRADRWVEVRAAAYDELISVATALEPWLVVDAGFCLEQDADAYSTAAGRNAMTVATLRRADHVVVVGAADPVGLTRLVRGLRDLTELVPGIAPLVVVNRMRATLGWSEQDVAITIDKVAPGAAVHFLPEDRAAADRSLMAGRSLVESGDSSLRRGVAELAQALSRRYNPVTV